MSHSNTNNHPLGAGGTGNDVYNVGRSILTIAVTALAWVNQPPETNNIQNVLNRLQRNNSSLVNNSAPLPTSSASMAANPTPQASSTPASSYQSKSRTTSKKTKAVKANQSSCKVKFAKPQLQLTQKELTSSPVQNISCPSDGTQTWWWKWIWIRSYRWDGR